MYWDQVTEDILFENKNFLESFINAEENSLYNEIQIKEEAIYLGDETIRKIDPLKLKD